MNEAKLDAICDALKRADARTHVPQSWRNALQNMHRNESIAKQEAGKDWRVVRVQKNGKRAEVDERGVRRFTEDEARKLAAYRNSLNPGSIYEAERA